jgi:hypothetical protein
MMFPSNVSVLLATSRWKEYYFFQGPISTWKNQYNGQATIASHIGALASISWLAAKRDAASKTSTARYAEERSSDRSKQCAGMAFLRLPTVKGGFSVGARFSVFTCMEPRVILAFLPHDPASQRSLVVIFG